MAFSAKVESIKSNAVGKFEYDVELDIKDVELLTDALKSNTSCEEVVLARTGIDDSGAAKFAEVIKENSSIKKLDLGYNNITGVGIEALAEAIAGNTTLLEVKIHRQEKDMGPAYEEKLCAIWKTNVTLVRLYATLHDRKFNGDNTRGEVRNKEISRRKAAGRDWIDLDPARVEEYRAIQDAERKKKAEADAIANAPISAKIESTGGPYTYKQLTALKEYLPDDLDYSAKESFLTDEEFQSIFEMDKEAFGKLPKWKQTQKKKDKNLN